MEHELKTWPQYFQDVKRGVKPFEIRKADRPYAVGDTLTLKEWDPEANQYTGDTVTVEVSYLLPGGAFGLDNDYCILGLRHRPTGTQAVPVPLAALEWMVNGCKGASSETMWAAFTGVPPAEWRWHPSDPGDFGRCVGLLDAVPEWRGRLSELASLTKFWAALIPKWDTVERLYRSGDRAGCNRALEDAYRPIYEATFGARNARLIS